MSGDETVLQSSQDYGVKVPLRTYSRHGRMIKRSSNPLPEHLTHPRDLTKPDNHGDTQRGARLDGPERRQWRRTTPMGKTPTEVFWEHLSSSAPALTHPSEADHLESSISIEAEEHDAPIDKQPHGARSGDELYAEQSTQEPNVSLGQRAHDPSHELRALQDTKEDDRSVGKRGKNEDLITPRPTQRRLLCLPPTPNPKRKRTRRSHDVDESLSVREATPSSAREVSKTSNAQCKDTDPQDFKNLGIVNENKVTISSDGFERDEARLGVVGKRRRIYGIDRGIGSLELTQKSAAAQKSEGPTWIRGQKKPRVAPTTHPWSRRQYFSISLFQIDSEEDDELVQVQQSKSVDHGTGNQLKRRTSLVVSDHDEESIILPSPDVLMGEYNTHSKAEVGLVRNSHADFLYISDDDESVMLLAHPADNEDEVPVTTTFRTNGPENSANVEGEDFYISDDHDSVVLLVYPEDNEDEAALATIPRTDTPETVAYIDKADGQLPAKQWVLNVLDSKEATLALRPDSREWMREVEIPDTSPRK